MIINKILTCMHFMYEHRCDDFVHPSAYLTVAFYSYRLRYSVDGAGTAGLRLSSVLDLLHIYTFD